MLLACFAVRITSYQSNSRARRGGHFPTEAAPPASCARSSKVTPIARGFESDRIPIARRRSIPAEIFRVRATDAQQPTVLQMHFSLADPRRSHEAPRDSSCRRVRFVTRRMCARGVITAPSIIRFPLSIGHDRNDRHPLGSRLADLYVTPLGPRERAESRETTGKTESSITLARLCQRGRWLPRPTLSK